MNRQPELNVSVRQMRAFVAIGRLASFTQAAALLHTTQPALSARIRELEDALAVRLFDRNTRSVQLTRAGEDLLPVVEQVLNDLGSVIERAKDVAARNTGRVAVAALPSVSSELLPATVARIRRRHPGITIGLRDAVADRVIELIRNREVDFGVTSVGGDPGFEFIPLGSDRIVAVLPREHPLAGRRKLTLAMLVEHPLILMDRDSSVRHMVDATYAALGRMSAPMFEATFMSTAVGLVRAGLGVTLLPSSAHEVRTATDLAVRTIDHPGLERTIGVLRLKGRSLSPAAEAFVAALAEEAKSRFSRPRRER
jgi:LysR family transcriptional regulator, carnitine catabolism transcriptional activator